MWEESNGKIKFLKGVLHLLPQNAQKLACFVLYLKIINIFFKNDTMHLTVNCPRNSKNNIEIKKCQAVLELLIQVQHFDCFDL